MKGGGNRTEIPSGSRIVGQSIQGPFGNPTLVTAGFQPSALLVGQLNGDSLPDLAVANAGSNTVSLHMNAGGGTISTLTTITVGTAPAELAVAELTGGTHLDLAVTSPTHPFNPRQFSLSNLGADADTRPGASHSLWP